MWKCLPVVVGCLIARGAAIAAEYVINVPELQGLNGSAPYTSVDVVVPLPTAFFRIDAASLRLSGDHFPGLVVSVIGEGQWPVSAVLQLEDAPPNLPYDYYPYPYFFRQLPVDLHDFSLEEPIVAPYETASDFRYWLDGSAEFTFSVGPPIINGTMAYAVYPLVLIERAELVVSGQPISVPEPRTVYLWTLAAIVARCVLRNHWNKPTTLASRQKQRRLDVKIFGQPEGVFHAD